MRIQIDADRIGPLKILPELPDARLAILEGLNGIGKTLAVRLLQVCTGDLPYSEEAPAWDSLRRNLGPFTVTVTDLRGATEIKWVADSREWYERADDQSTTVVFREMTIDGRAQPMTEVRGLLSVTRLGGEEGIVETLAQLADTYAETVRRWRRRYTDQDGGPLALLESAASSGLLVLGEHSADDFVSLTSDLESARGQSVSAEKTIEQERGRRKELIEALNLGHRLKQLRERAPDLTAKLQAVDAEIRDVDAAREQLQERVQALAGQVAAAGPLIKELSNARRTLGHRRRELSAQLNEAALLASELDIPPDQESMQALLVELDQQIEDLDRERTELDAAPSMRELLDDLDPTLDNAEHRGLGNQVTFEDPETELKLTVRETRAGMQIRRAFLEGKPPPPQAQDVAERIQQAMSVRDQALSLNTTLRQVDRFRRLVGNLEQRVRSALAAVNPGAIDQMQELEQLRREGDDRALNLAAERAILAQQLGAIGDEITEAALAKQLQTILKRTSVKEVDLASALAAAESALYEAEQELNEAEAQEGEARRELARLRAAARKAVTALATDAKLAWMQPEIPARALGDSVRTDLQLAVIDSARQRAEGTLERLGALRDQLGAIETALTGVGRHLRGKNPEAKIYLTELESWLGQHFSGWFNTGRVRQELLPEADGDVSVDVAARNVVWQQAGTSVSRPLEAFSSGEQAFAYTKARLARLDEEEITSANRLVVLDEFGAFIAHDLLGKLVTYLRDRAENHPNDQVLILLPLSSDYAKLAENAMGGEAEMYSRLAEQIAQQGYAVRVLVQ